MKKYPFLSACLSFSLLLLGCSPQTAASLPSAIAPPLAAPPESAFLALQEQEIVPAAAVAAPAAPEPETITAENLARLQPLLQLGIGEYNIAIDVSPDGRWLAVASAAGVLLYDTHSGALARQISTPATAENVAFSPDGRFIAASYRLGHGEVYSGGTFIDGLPITRPVLAVWQVSNGDLQFEKSLAGSGCGEWLSQQLAYSPDGSLIGFIEPYSLKNSLRLANLCLLSAANGDLIQRIDLLNDVAEGNLQDFAFSPTGQVVAIGTGETVYLHQALDGKRIKQFAVSMHVQSLAISPTGDRLLVAGNADEGEGQPGLLSLWSFPQGELLQTLPSELETPLSTAFSPDGHWLAVGASGGHLEIWNTTDGALVQRLGPVEAREDWYGSIVPIDIWDLAFSPDGETLYALADSSSQYIPSQVIAWRVADGQELNRFYARSDEARPAFSPDGSLLVAGGPHDGTIQAWNAADGSLAFELRGHSDLVNEAVFSPDGALIATASDDGSAGIWDVHDRNRLQTLLGHTGEVKRVAFSPDGSLLVTAALDGSLRLWKVSDGSLVASQEASANVKILSLAFTADGSALLYGTGVVDPVNGYRGDTRLWNLAQNQVTVLSDDWCSEAFTVNGQTYAACNNAQNDWQWQLTRLQGNQLVPEQALVSPKGNGALGGLTLSPDGQLLFSGNGFGLHVWNYPVHQLVSIVESANSLPYGFFAFSPDGKRMAIGRSTIVVWGVPPETP